MSSDTPMAGDFLSLLANQKLALFSERYREPEFEPQQVEVHIDTQGTVQVTGFPIAGIPA